MKFCPENKCTFCTKLFCCLQCRIRHEIDVHFSLFAEVISCELCHGSKGIVLQQKNADGFLNHLFIKHLPLQCRKCSVIFHNKDDLITVHTCVSSKIIENDKLYLKMALEGQQKIEPIIEEEDEQLKVTGVQNKKHSEELSGLSVMENVKLKIDGSIAENGSLIRHVSSIDNSENSDKTPLTNLVRQTSTPMTKMLHEIKRRSYDSMSASSIQMSSIDNCSSEHDVSPPLPPAPPNFNNFKQPSRRMPVAVTPYRQIMSKSIQRAFSSQGLLRGRNLDSTPPLDLRTSPVIRRTISVDATGKPRATVARSDAYMIDLRTTPVIRRTRQIEAKNIANVIGARTDTLNGTLNEYGRDSPSDQNVQNVMQESLHKSSLSRSKSTNTFFETCRSFESSTISGNEITDTPKTTGISKRSASFSNRQNVKLSAERKESWLLSSLETKENIATKSTNESPVENPKSDQEKELEDDVFAYPPSRGTIWSLFSSVFRLTSLGGSKVQNDNDANSASLIKRCASFTGILPKKPSIDLENDENPYKRRRTTTLSKVENQLGEDSDRSGRKQRINGRPPIDRMRQS